MNSRLNTMMTLFSCAVLVCACISCSQAAGDFHFDGKPSPEVLDRYLTRSITMGDFLTGNYPGKDEDIKLIRTTGAKFIGRAICLWGGESRLNDSTWTNMGRETASMVHAIDPDVVFQGCCFEIVTSQVNCIRIPSWAFEALGASPEDRNFDYSAMMFPDGKYTDAWGRETCVPDIRQLETQLWYMYLIGTYVDIGCEAIHLGQNMLVGEQDKGWRAYDGFLQKVHAYADPRARRHYVLFDAHAGDEGMFTADGRSLLDYNSFPLRIKETPEDGFMTARLEKGFLDAMYGRYDHPYLVEFDNYGCSDHPGKALEPDPMNDFGDSIFVWGYDEISWLYCSKPEDRKQWLKYAFDWLKENDPYAHLEMPGTRVVVPENGKSILGRAVPPSGQVPDGMDLVSTIKELWDK